MRVEDIFQCLNIDCTEDDGYLYIDVDPDRGVYGQVTKDDVIRLAKFFKLAGEDLES